ncbi:hypothetical protein V6Z12_D07G206000 [Gossypium hirsutum]
MLSTLPISPFLFSRKAHLKPSTILQNLIVTNKARPFDSENTIQLRCGKGMVVVDGMGVCDGAGGRQHGRVGVVLVADSMGEWEEASGSLGFWDFILDFIIWVICWYGPGQKWAFTAKK